MGYTEIMFDISIFNADNLNELLDERYYDDLEYLKITNNLLKFIWRENSFYYNEKDNKIEYIDNIFNYINKIFRVYYYNQLKEKKLYQLNENNKLKKELLYYENQLREIKEIIVKKQILHISI